MNLKEKGLFIFSGKFFVKYKLIFKDSNYFLLIHDMCFYINKRVKLFLQRVLKTKEGV